MRAFAAVARREILEKRFVLAAALVAAVIPFAVPLVRGLGGETARETRNLTAVILAVGISTAVALGLGASVFAGELAAKRMGFFLSRPISIPALWGGKLAGALLLVAGCFALIVGPAALLDRKQIPAGEAAAELAMSAAGLVLIFLFANAVSTVVRSRSALAAADLVAAGVLSLVCASAVSRLSRGGFSAIPLLVVAAATLLAGAFLFASYRALAGGRTDLRAAHAAFSAALWGILATGAALFAGYAVWAVHAPPSAMTRVDTAVRSGAGDWVVVEGRARGLNASFLYDLRSGRSHRFVSPVLETSPDGKMAAWLAAESPRGPWTLTTLRLDDPRASERETKIVLAGRTWPLILAPGGSRIAVVSGRLLTVYDLDSGRALVSVQVREKDDAISGTFVTPDLLRILKIAEAGGPGRSRVHSMELDVTSRRFSVVGANENLVSPAFLRSPSGGDLLVIERTGSRAALLDPRTLAVKAVLRQGPPGWWAAAFLSDGRIAFAASDTKSSRAEVFSPYGAPIARVPLGGPGRVRLGGEPGADELFVSITPDEFSPGGFPRHLFLIDWKQGSAKEIARGLEPVAASWRDPRPVPPGSELSKAFLTDKGGLVRLDPATCERRVLLGHR